MKSEELRVKRREQRVFGLQIVLMVLWGSQLLYTDAYYVNYLLILVVTGICIYQNIKQPDANPPCRQAEKRNNLLCCLFAILFSCMVALANYELWGYQDTKFGNTFDRALEFGLTIVFFFGGFFAFRQIFLAACQGLRSLIWKQNQKESVRPGVIFLLVFLSIVLTRSIVLFFCRYPGILSLDSIVQIEQIFSGSYSNHHPFYHTLLIRSMMSLGMMLFDDINAAVATYSFFQILLTAFCFSYAVSTTARMKAPGWIVLSSALFFLLMPYHLIYAVTMWKDVPWGCFILLFVISFFRCQSGIGSEAANLLLLTVSGLGICLFRSNGFFVFLLLTVTFVFLWRFQYKKQMILFLFVIVCSFILKHPVLESLQVTQPDTIEALSIPAQQIARVVQEGCELNDWERGTLEAVIDMEQIPEQYNPHHSNPIKYLVRDKGNQHLIKENKGDYLKLYFSLGLKYPKSYLRAWIDQTKGYWNSGYDYGRWSSSVHENEFGIERTVRSNRLNSMLKEYLWLFTEIQGLRPLVSIGLFVWVDLLMLFIAWIRKDKLGAFLGVPILAVVLSLLIATPLYSSFRYIYSAFCALPMVGIIALRPLEPKQTET